MNHDQLYSPQTPGVTCWVGAWIMPDGDLMTSFTQATGPVEAPGTACHPRAVQAADGRIYVIGRDGGDDATVGLTSRS